MSNYINIAFPFTDSQEGNYVDLTKTTKEAIKSNLMHLILTQKGERMYMPSFGTNLRKFLFEQLDTTTIEAIQQDISIALTRYISNLKIDKVEVDKINTELTARVIIRYTITDNVFEESDIIIIDL